MIILAPRKTVGFENSVNNGGIPYALLPGKHHKSSDKSVHLDHFKRTQFMIYPRFMTSSEFDSYSNTKLLKAISIATSQAVQSN